MITVENGQIAVLVLYRRGRRKAFRPDPDGQPNAGHGWLYGNSSTARSWIRLPIVAVTASAMTGDREKFIAAGCNDYISKPIAAHKLVDLVKRWEQLVQESLGSW